MRSQKIIENCRQIGVKNYKHGVGGYHKTKWIELLTYLMYVPIPKFYPTFELEGAILRQDSVTSKVKFRMVRFREYPLNIPLVSITKIPVLHIVQQTVSYL